MTARNTSSTSTRTRNAGHVQRERNSGQNNADVLSAALNTIENATDGESFASAIDATQDGTNADVQSATPIESPTTEEVTDDAATRITALADVLEKQDASEALAAICNAHFGGSAVTLLRTLVRSLSFNERNAALFTRKRSADGSVVTYNVCGYVATNKRDARGMWTFSGFDIDAMDASKNAFRKTFGAATNAQATEERSARNGFAGLRNGFLWIMTERETTREVAHASGQDSAALASAEQRAKDAEERAKRAEESLTKLTATQDTQNAMLAAIMERLAARDARTTEATEEVAS